VVRARSPLAQSDGEKVYYVLREDPLVVTQP
jgi:hypothetical protein